MIDSLSPIYYELWRLQIHKFPGNLKNGANLLISYMGYNSYNSLARIRWHACLLVTWIGYWLQ